MSNFYDLITEGVSVPLTRLAAGYTPVGLIGTQVFPIAKAAAMSGKVPIFNKDAFKIYQTLRASGAKTRRAVPDPDDWISYSLEEHDLAYPLDNRDLEALRALPGDAKLKALFNLQNRQRTKVQWNLALELEKLIADAVQNTASYPSGHYVTLATTTCWSETSTSDPVTDIETGKEVVRSKIGRYPNTLIMGNEAYKQLKFHTKYTDKLKYTTDKIVTPDIIKNVHDLDKVIIGQSLMLPDASSSSGNDATVTFSDLWGDNAILAYVPPTQFPDIDEPGFGYTIRPMFGAKPYPYVDVFTEEGGKIVNVRCTDMYDTLFLMAFAGYLIKNVKK